jgi:hypothetical protein
VLNQLESAYAGSVPFGTFHGNLFFFLYSLHFQGGPRSLSYSTRSVGNTVTYRLYAYNPLNGEHEHSLRIQGIWLTFYDILTAHEHHS